MLTPSPPRSTTVAAGRDRRDRALRLRKRIVVGVAASSTVAVGGLAVLAQHSFAGTASTGTAASAGATGGTSASSAGVAGATDSGSSAQTGTPAAPATPSLSPVPSGGGHAVSGGS